MEANLNLDVLNRSFTHFRTIDEYDSFIWNDRYNGAGDFEIEIAVNKINILAFIPNYYIRFDESEHIMIIEDLNIKTDSEDGDVLLVTGRSLESILDRRIVWEQTLLTGNFQNGIERLLNEAFINPIDPDRKIPNLIFKRSTDPEITKLTIDNQFTGDNVYTVIQGLCSIYDLGFKIILNDKDQLEFSLYKGIDRSYAQVDNTYVIFSPEFENIIGSEYFESTRPLKTIGLVAGEGEGKNRTKITIGDKTQKGLDRRESFIDAKHITSKVENQELSEAEYLLQLSKFGLIKMSGMQIAKSFDGTVDTTKTFNFQDEFFMGDIVQVEDSVGLTGRSRIIEFIFSDNESNGIERYPTFDMLEEDEIA